MYDSTYYYMCHYTCVCRVIDSLQTHVHVSTDCMISITCVSTSNTCVSTHVSASITCVFTHVYYHGIYYMCLYTYVCRHIADCMVLMTCVSTHVSASITCVSTHVYHYSIHYMCLTCVCIYSVCPYTCLLT